MTAIMIDRSFSPMSESGFLDAMPSTPSDRISLVMTPAPEMRDWAQASPSTAIVFRETPADPAQLLADILEGEALDVVRLVLDGGISTRCFLNVLAALPGDSAAEILWICDDGTGYLSAIGRGCDRVLYALTGEDVRFYLEVHGLVAERQILRRVV